MTKNRVKENNWFNWGTGITAVIILFVTGTLSVVAFLVSLDFEMVTENHYEKAVNYQEHINRVEHASMLDTPVEIRFVEKDNKIEIQFPHSLHFSDLEGEVLLYRPSNSDLDQKLALSLNADGMQQISAENMQKGKWEVKINWSNRDGNFFSEKQLFL